MIFVMFVVIFYTSHEVDSHLESSYENKLRELFESHTIDR